MIDYDCETDGLQPWNGKRAFLYIFQDDERHEAIFAEDRNRIQGWFAEANKDPEGIRAHNTKFDRAFGDVGGFEIPGDGHWHDSMIEAHVINERRSVSLDNVAEDVLGDGAGKGDFGKAVKKWLVEERARRKKAAKEAGEELIEPTYADVPNEIIVPYGLNDTDLARKVSAHHKTLLDQSPDLRRVVEFERGVLDALYAVEKRGLPASEDDYRHLEIEVIENLELLEERVDALAAEAGIDDFNPKSTPQIIDALKARDADMRFMSKKDGKDSADAENLRAVDDELAEAILDFRSEYKVLSTYVRPMIGRHYETGMRLWKEPFVAPDGRIHANYRQLGARTGRMSCSDPNMQNQPRDDLRLRYCIRAEEGHKLVACDLSNIEMVLFAFFAGEGKLLETLRGGGDVHVLTAQMLGIRDRKRAGGAVESARQLGKTYNFSRIYGGGLTTIKRQFRCSMDEARLLKKRFDDAYPEAKTLTRRIEYRLQDQGYIADKYISGRRFRVDVRDAYKGTNYLVQGTAAAVLKEAAVKLHKDGIPVCALIHDEVLAHVPEADAEEVQHTIIERLTENEAINEIIKLRAEGVICDRWSDAKPLKDGSLFVPKFAAAA